MRMSDWSSDVCSSDLFRDLSAKQRERTFKTNVFGYFYMTKAALDHLGPGSAIVNTTSITAYQGYPKMVDYSATRGAIVAFTRSMAGALVDKGIRVNAGAPGPTRPEGRTEGKEGGSPV